MKYTLLVFVFIFLTFAQEDTLTFKVLYNHPENKIRQFEIKLLNKVVRLYNSKNHKKLKPQFVRMDEPNAIWYYLYALSDKSDRELVCGLTSATRYDHPRVSFSEPFIPIRLVLIGRKGEGVVLDKHRKYKMGHLLTKNTNSKLYKELIDYNIEHIKVDNYERFYPMMQTKEIDIYFGDSIDEWIYNDLQIIHYLDEKPTYMSFVFQKESDLKPLLDSVLSYYTKSSSYYRMLREHFGRDLRHYFTKISTNKH